MQMHIKTLLFVVTFFNLFLALPAIASFSHGSIITESGVKITPTIQTGFSSNNNFFSTPEDEKSRLIWTFEPNLKAAIEDGPDSYKLDIGTHSALHNKDSLDNYTQVNIGTAIHKEFTSKQRLDMKGNIDWLYEKRGRGLTEGLGDDIDELVKYQLKNASARYEYGAQSAKALIAFEGGYFSKEYQNFRELSQYRDYDKYLVGITGYYNTQAATRMFIEAKQENYRYDVLASSGVTRDSNDLKILGGIQWDASAITSGTFKLGYQNKDFEANERESFSGLSWEASVSWKPLSYSTLQLRTSRSAKDPLVQGDYIKESLYGVDWSHDWSNKLSSLARVSYMNEQYTGNIGREDKTKNLRFGISYMANKFGMVSTYVDFVDKNSSQYLIEYDRVTVGINFTFALKANK